MVPRAQRVAVTALVQCRWETLEAFVPEYASDISTSGVFIRSEAPRPVGAMVFLQVALRGGGLVEAFGRVARLGRDSQGVAGMGVHFVAFDEESKALVEALVEQSGG
jgi:uncharacterized protein (TIGR02266 family)